MEDEYVCKNAQKYYKSRLPVGNRVLFVEGIDHVAKMENYPEISIAANCIEKDAARRKNLNEFKSKRKIEARQMWLLSSFLYMRFIVMRQAIRYSTSRFRKCL